MNHNSTHREAIGGKRKVYLKAHFRANLRGQNNKRQYINVIIKKKYLPQTPFARQSGVLLGGGRLAMEVSFHPDRCRSVINLRAAWVQRRRKFSRATVCSVSSQSILVILVRLSNHFHLITFPFLIDNRIFWV